MERQDFYAVVARHAASTPDRIAISFGAQSVSFHELLEGSNSVAAALTGAGVRPGQHVAHLGRSNPCYFDLLAGAVGCGAVMVGINWRLVGPEVAYILDHSESKVLFVDPEFLPLVTQIRADRQHLEHVVVIGTAQDGLASLDDWCSQATSAPAHSPNPEDVAVLVYTSGTTGRPKGAQITHRGMDAVFERMQHAPAPYWSSPPEACFLITFPLYNISGVVPAYAALRQGCRMIITDGFVPSEILRLISENPIEMIGGAPTMIQMLLEDPTFPNTDFSRLKWVGYGAAPMPPDLLRTAMTAMGVEFSQGYGMTENTGMTTMLAPEEHHDVSNPRLASVGTPLPGIEMRIVGPDGTDLAPGEVGEIWIRSESVMSGYWKQPDATAEVITDGWLHTGDAASVDEDGFVYLKDRIKDVIISGGANIYPAEVENAIFGHESVAEVAVVGVPDPKWGEVPKAFVVLREGKALDDKSLLAFAGERIARFKLPKYFEAVATLPRNPSGKVMRFQLRNRAPG